MQTRTFPITNLSAPRHGTRHAKASSVTPQPRAFTLIELLVAISVLSLMMTLAARIFFDAQKGVQRGLQTSQIIAESRSISQPLSEDVREMNVFSSKYESNSPGFLIISQRALDGVRFPEPGNINADPSTWLADRDGDGTPGEFADASDDDMMRSDQIGFFRDANGLESLTPGQADRYDSDTKARHARIWYGHTSPVTGGASLNPGDPDYDLASQIVLGRQALLLVENDAATNYPNGNAGDSVTPGSSRLPGANTSVEDSTYEGLYDTFDLSSYLAGTYSIYDDQGVDPAGGPRGLFRTPTWAVPASGNESLFGIIAFGGGADRLPTLPYRNLAADWMYLSAGRRLQAATSIDTEFGAGIFDANTLAQLHAAFAPHVADFAIEIACDWTDDLDPNDFDTDGNTFEADGFPDNEPDRDGFGNIKWYTLIRPNPDGNNDGVGDTYPFEPVTYDALDPGILISRFDGNPANNFGLGVNPFVFVNDFIFSHTGDDNDLVTTDVVDGCGKYWPYLIRFRYRLMDGKGEFRSIEVNPDSNDDDVADDPVDVTVVGRWFEQVVPVPRPQGLY